LAAGELGSLGQIRDRARNPGHLFRVRHLELREGRRGERENREQQGQQLRPAAFTELRILVVHRRAVAADTGGRLPSAVFSPAFALGASTGRRSLGVSVSQRSGPKFP
jgi:hypothetical protein